MSSAPESPGGTQEQMSKVSRGTVIQLIHNGNAKGRGLVHADDTQAQLEFDLSEWQLRDTPPKIGARVDFIATGKRATQVKFIGTYADPPPVRPRLHERLYAGGKKLYDWAFTAFVLVSFFGGLAFFLFVAPEGKRQPRLSRSEPASAPSSQIEAKLPEQQLLEMLQQTPMLRLILRDDPKIEAEVRTSLTAIAEARSAGARAQAADHVSSLLVSARRRYMLQLVDADDSHLLEFWSATTRLVQHLSKTNQRLCKQYFLTGMLENANHLDPSGRSLLLELVAATEAAVLNGRGQVGRNRVATVEEAGQAFGRMGFTVSEVEMIDGLAKQSDAQACKLALKFYEGAAKVPDDIGVPFMRWSFGTR